MVYTNTITVNKRFLGGLNHQEAGAHAAAIVSFW
jgi:hypothetical protein